MEMDESCIQKKIDNVRKALAMSEKEIEETSKQSRIVMATMPDFKYVRSQKDYDFRQLEENKNLTPFYHLNLSSAHMRNILHKIYVKQRQVPTINDIIDAAKESNFYQSLTHPKGFIFLAITSSTKGIIVEDPERIAKRTAYIMKMDNFRKNDRHFIYVYSSNLKDVTRIRIAVSSKSGLLSTKEHVECLDQEIEFFTDVLSGIEDHCVVVMEEEEEKIPTVGTFKSTMSAWLKKNNIPHDPNSHRSELYNLILKMKNVVPSTSKVDECILGLGHEVIRRPTDMEELDFFRTGLHTDYKNKPLESWFEFEDKLIESEKTMYINDLMMDKIIDSIMAYAKDTEETEAIQGLLDFNDWKKRYETVISE